MRQEKTTADVVLGARLHSAMGAAVAWEPAGQHVASVALDGTIVVMVRSCAEPCMHFVFAELPVWHQADCHMRLGQNQQSSA